MGWHVDQPNQTTFTDEQLSEMDEIAAALGALLVRAEKVYPDSDLENLQHGISHLSRINSVRRQITERHRRQHD